MTPSKVVVEQPSHAEISQTENEVMDLLNPIDIIVDKVYPKEVAKKYHFVEAFLKSDKGEKEVKTGEAYRQTTMKSSLERLLSSNMLDDAESVNRLRATIGKNQTNM